MVHTRLSERDHLHPTPSPMLGVQAGHQAIHLGLGGRDGRSLADASHDLQPVVLAVLRRGRPERQRQPQPDPCPGPAQVVELPRHDPDDGEGFVAHPDRSPDDRRIAGEGVLPQAPAQDDGPWAPRGVCLRSETCSQKRRHAVHRKEVRGNPQRWYPLPTVAWLAGEVHLGLNVGGHALERRAQPPIILERRLRVRIGKSPVLFNHPVKAHQPLGRGIGQRHQGQRVRDREHGRRRPEAQGQNHQRRDRERRLSAKRTNRQAHVLGQLPEKPAQPSRWHTGRPSQVRASNWARARAGLANLCPRGRRPILEPRIPEPNTGCRPLGP